MYQIKKNTGFSMIELMIGVGIGAIVSLGMGTMISQFSSQVQQQEDKLSVLNAEQEIMTLLENKNTCTAALRGTSISPGSGKELGTYKKGEKISHRVEVDDVIVNSVNNVGTSATDFSAQIEVRFKNTVDANKIYKPLNLVVYYNQSGGVIDSCGGSGTVANLEAGCASVGGTWNSGTSSCDIDNKICTNLLGGTMESDGTCSGVGASPTPPPPTPAGCPAVTYPASESSQSRDYRFNNYGPSECALLATNSGVVQNGTCGSRFGGYRSSGSCSYQCMDGSWTKLSNSCGWRR